MNRRDQIEKRLWRAALTEDHAGYARGARADMLRAAPNDLVFLLAELKTLKSVVAEAAVQLKDIAAVNMPYVTRHYSMALTELTKRLEGSLHEQ